MPARECPRASAPAEKRIRPAVDRVDVRDGARACLRELLVGGEGRDAAEVVVSAGTPAVLPYARLLERGGRGDGREGWLEVGVPPSRGQKGPVRGGGDDARALVIRSGSWSADPSQRDSERVPAGVRRAAAVGSGEAGQGGEAGVVPRSAVREDGRATYLHAHKRIDGRRVDEC